MAQELERGAGCNAETHAGPEVGGTGHLRLRSRLRNCHCDCDRDHGRACARRTNTACSWPTSGRCAKQCLAVQNLLVHRICVLGESANGKGYDGAGAGAGCRTRCRNRRGSRNGGHWPPATAAATAAATATGPTTATAAATAAVAAVGTLHAICQSVITVPSQLSACTTVLVDGPGIWAVSSGKGVFAAPVRWVVRVVPGVRAEAGRLRASKGVAGKRSHLPRHACA